MLRYLTILLCVFLLASCMPSPYYQKNHTVPGNAWDLGFKPGFKVAITDTGVFYTVYFLIRHTEAYPYSNLWLRVHSTQPGDTIPEVSRIEIPLAAPSGQWLGRGMGGIWEHRMILTGRQDKSLFAKPGTYELSLEQDMRVNPLPEVLQVGLRVEKGEKRTGISQPDNP